jgi:hypothetical protein
VRGIDDYVERRISVYFGSDKVVFQETGKIKIKRLYCSRNQRTRLQDPDLVLEFLGIGNIAETQQRLGIVQTAFIFGYKYSRFNFKYWFGVFVEKKSNKHHQNNCYKKQVPVTQKFKIQSFDVNGLFLLYFGIVGKSVVHYVKNIAIRNTELVFKEGEHNQYQSNG